MMKFFPAYLFVVEFGLNKEKAPSTTTVHKASKYNYSKSTEKNAKKNLLLVAIQKRHSEGF